MPGPPRQRRNLAGDELSWIGCKYSQHFGGLRAQPDRTSGLAKLSRVDIKFEDTEAKRKVPEDGLYAESES